MEQNTIQGESGSQPMSLLSKVTGIFTSPEKTFEHIRQKPEVWFPLILLILISVVGILLTTDLQKKAQQEFINNSELIPEDRKTDMLDNLENQGMVNSTIVPSISAVVGVLIYYAVIAGAFLLFGNFIYGGNATYKNMFTLAVWGSLVGIVESAVKIPLMLSKGTMKVFTSPAIFLDISESESIFFKILDAFDIFAIWKIIVFSLGFSVFYKFAKGKSYAAIVSLYIIYLVISISLSQLFKGFIS